MEKNQISKPVIKWVNHASFIVNYNEVSMISDPWLEGPAFYEGWHLLSEGKFKYEDFSGITHMWFSHEHPDHFVPGNLKKISEDHRKNIQVLYQKTLDQKVINFCKNISFPCTELDPGTPVKLAEDFSVVCRPFSYDSWSLIEVGGLRILNLNDCPVRKEADLKKLKEQVGEVDILMTQFSYAGWIGNPSDKASHELEAQKYIDQVVAQIRAVKPKKVIPFASFIYFCHEENLFMNESVNNVADICREIEKQTDAEPIVLYPGDEWEIGSEWSNEAAIQNYLQDEKNIPSKTNFKTKTVSIEELKELSAKYCTKLKKGNSLWMLAPIRAIGYLRTTNIYLMDLDQSVSFDYLKGFKQIDLKRDQCDVVLSSDSLAYCFRFLWGHSTLSINGRFQTTPAKTVHHFMRQFKIGLDVNNGQVVNFKYMMQLVLNKLKR